MDKTKILVIGSEKTTSILPIQFIVSTIGFLRAEGQEDLLIVTTNNKGTDEMIRYHCTGKADPTTKIPFEVLEFTDNLTHNSVLMATVNAQSLLTIVFKHGKNDWLDFIIDTNIEHKMAILIHDLKSRKTELRIGDFREKFGKDFSLPIMRKIIKFLKEKE